MQATEALCHLSVTDIKKIFYNVWFFCKNEACVNCGTLNATTLIWLPQGTLKNETDIVTEKQSIPCLFKFIFVRNRFWQGPKYFGLVNIRRQKNFSKMNFYNWPTSKDVWSSPQYFWLPQNIDKLKSNPPISNTLDPGAFRDGQQ